MLFSVRLTPDALSLSDLSARVASLVPCGTFGAMCSFEGVTRSTFEGKTVLRLEYEAYESMAKKQLEAIAGEIVDKMGCCAVGIEHRTGVVAVGEASVIIAVASAHRKEAIRGMEYAIDTIKEKVAIWKKEVYEDGSVWKENKECAWRSTP
jgi:molybdopterin synthase catalytic subunit